MDINTLEVIRNILINYPVSIGTIKAATGVGLAFLILISSAVISAGVTLNRYDTLCNKEKTLNVKSINKLKSKIKSKKKEH